MSLILLFLVVNVAVLIVAKPDEYDIQAEAIFNSFITKYDRNYRSNEIKTHYFETFKKNLRTINRLNSELPKTATFTVNEFSDLTLEEFVDQYTGFNNSGVDDDTDSKRFVYDETSTRLSSTRDYREGGLLMVKHQRNCRNSYVYSAVGNIEAQFNSKFKLFTLLSEQHAFDCEPKGNCKEGGVPHHVFESLINEGGLMQYIDYQANPSNQKGTCRTDKENVYVNIQRYARFNTISEKELMAAVDTIGPLSTTIYVSESVKNYKSGVLDPKDCQKSTNHAVVLMGYGEENGVLYWIVKNSWGPDWGENGYMRLIRGKNACNIGKEYVATVLLDKSIQHLSNTPKTNRIEGQGTTQGINENNSTERQKTTQGFSENKPKTNRTERQGTTQGFNEIKPKADSTERQDTTQGFNENKPKTNSIEQQETTQGFNENKPKTNSTERQGTTKGINKTDSLPKKLNLSTKDKKSVLNKEKTAERCPKWDDDSSCSKDDFLSTTTTTTTTKQTTTTTVKTTLELITAGYAETIDRS